ncbi:hypothetical protein HD554DRAFT_2171925 [Boletus coccyginus]|nr:hypothetical protein HD554DRAFT_2171925 [Boletus coccyginus]
MSLLTFLGLRQPLTKYNRAPLTLADVLHRTLVTSLTALSIYGIYLGYSVHDHVMTKGKGTFCGASPWRVGSDAQSFFPSLYFLFPPFSACAEALVLKEAEAMARKEAQAAEEAREQSLAEAAQGALPKRS